MTKIGITFVLMAMLVMTGCTASQEVLLLQAVVAAADGAVAASGTCPACVVYLNAVASGASCASTELGSTDTGAILKAKIVECFVAATAQAIPQGPWTAAINAVNAALANFLNNIKTAAIPKINSTDRKILDGIRAKSADIRVRLHPVR